MGSLFMRLLIWHICLIKKKSVVVRFFLMLISYIQNLITGTDANAAASPSPSPSASPRP